MIHDLIDEQRQWYIQLLDQWPVIMGALAQRARVEKVVDTTLVIGVYETHWMHEIHALSRTILKRVHTVVAADRITDIRCVWVGKTLKRQHELRAVHHPSTIAHHAPALKLSEQRTLHTVGDSELQDFLYRYFVRCDKVKKS